MLILACDTSNSTCCAGLYEGGKELEYELSLETRTHSETFMPLVDRVLNKAGKTYNDIDAMAVTVGPGSFTGIRIGVSAIKGIAIAIDKPCIAVSSTHALAASVETESSLPEETIIVPCFDARNSRVFGSVVAHQNMEVLVQEDAYSNVDLASEILNIPDVRNKKIYVVGNGAEVMREVLEAMNIKAEYAPGAVILPRGIAASALMSKKLISAAELAPSYCAVSSAERLRK